MEEWSCIVGGLSLKTGDVYPVLNPYTGREEGGVHRAGRRETEAALAAAVRGSEETARLPSHARAAVLHRLAVLMEENRDLFIRLLIAEGGKPVRNAEIETVRAIETIRISAEEAVRISGEVIALDRTSAGEGRTGFIQRFPVGIVLGITPFNFPLNLACHKLGPAVASGNAIIIKPASQTPFSSLLLGSLLLRAGYPPSAVSILPCRAADAEVLASDPRIGCLSFTGSPDVGWHLRSVACCGKVSLELGGNAAVIVHEDADIPVAAARIVEGGFSQAGQVCISVQRVFVHRRVYEDLLEIAGILTDRLVVGDPADPRTDIGPLISVEAAERAVRLVRDAISGGAVVFRGGNATGPVMQPTILTGTHPDMEIACREAFAPVIMVTPYDTFEEAVDMCNNSIYGLQAGVFTRDISRAQYAFRRLRVGAVLIGDIPTFRVDMMPYGGTGRSGCGREGPRYAIEEMTESRMMILRE